MKRLFMIFCVTLAVSYLQGCGYTHQIRMYQSSDNSANGEMTPVIKEVETDNEHLNKAVNLIAYPVVLSKSSTGYYNTVMDIKYDILSRRPEKWNFGNYYSLDGNWRLAQDMNNESLTESDVTIFEFTIAGLSNNKETRRIKRFTGPVKTFDWVDLFKVKVPKDNKGHIMTVVAYINYLPEINIENKKRYFSRVPVAYSDNNVSYFSHRSTAPFMDFNYENGKTTLLKKGSDDSDRGKFYEEISLVLAQNTYKNFYYMNPSFLKHNNLIRSAKNKRKEISIRSSRAAKQAALYGTYTDEKEFEEILRTSDKATQLITRLKRSLKYRTRNARDLATARSRSTASSGIAESNRKTNESYAVINYRFTDAKNTVSNNMSRFNKLAHKQGGISVRKKSLDAYNKTILAYAKALPLAEDSFQSYRSAITSLLGTSPKSKPSFLSIAGQAMSNEVARGGYSGNSGYSSGMNMISNHQKAMENARVNQTLHEAGYNASSYQRNVTSASGSSYKGNDDTLIVKDGPKLKTTKYYACGEDNLAYARGKDYYNEMKAYCNKQKSGSKSGAGSGVAK